MNYGEMVRRFGLAKAWCEKKDSKVNEGLAMISAEDFEELHEILYHAEIPDKKE